MLDFLIMAGGIGGTYMFLTGVYGLLTGHPPQNGFTLGEQIVGGGVWVVIGYQAWKFKMRRESRRAENQMRSPYSVFRN